MIWSITSTSPRTRAEWSHGKGGEENENKAWTCKFEGSFYQSLAYGVLGVVIGIVSLYLVLGPVESAQLISNLIGFVYPA
jgi:hypothetical protein